MSKKLLLLFVLLQSAFISCFSASLPGTPPPQLPKKLITLMKNERTIRELLTAEKIFFFQKYREVAQLIAHPETSSAEAMQSFEIALRQFDQSTERLQAFENFTAVLEDLLILHKRMEVDYKYGRPYKAKDLAQLPILKQEYREYWGEFCMVCRGSIEIFISLQIN